MAEKNRERVRVVASHSIASHPSPLMSSTTVGVAFGSDEPSHSSITIQLLQLLLVLLLLTPLWMTAIYAWQREGERAHGTLQAWQDATPAAQRAVVSPAKALAWALVHRIRGSMPLQIRQATGGLQGHRLVAADEEAADEAEDEAEGTRRSVRATPETPAQATGAMCGMARRTTREPQVLADAELSLAPVVTQEALQVAGGCTTVGGDEAEERATEAGTSLQLAPPLPPPLPSPPLYSAAIRVADVLVMATEAAATAEAAAAAAAEAAEAPLPTPPPPPPPAPPPLCPPPVRPPPTATMLDNYDPKKSMGMVCTSTRTPSFELPRVIATHGRFRALPLSRGIAGVPRLSFLQH